MSRWSGGIAHLKIFPNLRKTKKKKKRKALRWRPLLRNACAYGRSRTRAEAMRREMDDNFQFEDGGGTKNIAKSGRRARLPADQSFEDSRPARKSSTSASLELNNFLTTTNRFDVFQSGFLLTTVQRLVLSRCSVTSV
ncbi:hypothetical protein ILYODFUR_005861 [Ilyodon furcidens]|uniref:Uncharacterized protein n=1 Tax=Ilyodon furcidens TaxID=33524 RepID=A0ABV0U5R3_9TELE